MKKILLFISAIFICTICFAHTINWHANNQIISTTTCNSGDNITPPTAPTKYGYHFIRWSPYIFLEYIESTGTQYIDTGIPVTDNVSVKIKIMRPENTQINGSVFGYRFVDSAAYIGNMRYFFIYQDGRIALRNGGKCGTNNTIRKLLSNTDYVIDYSVYNIKVDNETWVTCSYAYETADFGDGYIFNANTTGYYSADMNRFIGRVYYLKLYDNNTLVHNFVAAKRTGDNAIGMYDTVTETFFENAGTGEFIAGPEIQ